MDHTGMQSSTVNAGQDIIDQFMIVETGLDALLHVIHNVEVIRDFTPPPSEPDDSFSIISNGKFVQAVDRLCMYQVIACNCLFDDGKKRYKFETDEMVRLRQQRVAFVKKKTDGIDTTNLSNRSFRNAWAHIDEYMLKALIENSTTRDKDWTFNIGFNSVDTISKLRGGRDWRKKAVKVVIFQSKTLHLLGTELNYDAIQQEATAVAQAMGWPRPLNGLQESEYTLSEMKKINIEFESDADFLLSKKQN